MGLEDLAMFRAILDSVVLYPCDAVSTERLVEAMARHVGISYLRTTRLATPILYGPEEKFPIGGCKVLRQSQQDVVTVVTAGITVFEALKAHDELQNKGLAIRVIDLYSVKPVAEQTLKEAAAATRAIITVEDHYPEGGLGDAVRTALAAVPTPVYSLAVHLKPKTGKPAELLDFEGISKDGIIKKVMDLLHEFKLAAS
jgi:transketolase